jgi:hypothetical protein
MQIKWHVFRFYSLRLSVTLLLEWKGERFFSACREKLIQMNEQKGAHENIRPVFNPMGVQIFSDGLFS